MQVKKNNIFNLYQLVLALTVIALSTHTITTPTASPGDLATIRSLFQEALIKHKNHEPLTQTQALAYLFNKHSAQLLSGIKSFKPRLRKIIMREEATNNTHYAFYCVIPQYQRVLSDLTRLMYRWKYGKVGALTFGAFTFIRFNFCEIENTTISLDQFIENQLKNNAMLMDTSQTQPIILKADVTPFGSCQIAQESTWRSLTTPSPWNMPSTHEIQSLLYFFNYSPLFIQDIQQLSRLFKNNDGYSSNDLIQIFIPRAMVDRIAYASWRLGIPLARKTISMLLGNKPIKQAALLPQSSIENALKAYKATFARLDQTAHATFAQLKKEITKGVLLPSHHIDRFKLNPCEYIPGTQARILVSLDTLLNPNSNILIYRYAYRQNNQYLAKYKQQLHSLFATMESERKERIQTKNDLLHRATNVVAVSIKKQGVSQIDCPPADNDTSTLSTLIGPDVDLPQDEITPQSMPAIHHTETPIISSPHEQIISEQQVDTSSTITGIPALSVPTQQ